MAVYDLEEQEKIEDLKAWWAQYGKYVSAAVTTFAIVVIGVQAWRWYQTSNAEKASILYQAVSQAARANDLSKAKDPATQLESRYASTAYAPRGMLLYAKMLYDSGDTAGAKAALQWVIDHSGEDELKTIARFRLGQALLGEKKYDEALKTLDVKIDPAFTAVFADLKGDILLAAGKSAEAKEAYQTALAKSDPTSQYRQVIQVKLDALGGPTAVVPDAATQPIPSAPPAVHTAPAK